MALDIDSLDSTRAIEYPVISPSDADGMFDLITYEKGGSILRMLEQFLGQEIFRDGVSLYLTKHSYGNTETDDLWDALEEVSNLPVKKVMDSWIFQPGHPMISYSLKNEKLSISQKTFRYLNSDHETIWGVPIFIKYSIGNKTKEIKFLLDTKENQIVLEKGVESILLNSNSYGFYRTNTTDFDSIYDVSHLTSEEKYSILDDYWGLILSGSMSVEKFLDFTEKFYGETDPDILSLLYSCFSNLSKNLPNKERLIKVGETIFRNTFENLDEHAKRSIREAQSLAICYRAMAIVVEDLEIIDKSKKILDDYLNGKSDYEPDIISSVISINAHFGSSKLFETYLDNMNNAKTPQDEVRFQRSLSLFQNDEDILKLFSFILDNKIRSQDSPYLLASCLNNEKMGWKTWEFIEKNWDGLVTKFPENSIVRMLSGIRSLNKRKYLDHINLFFSEEGKIKQGKLQLKQHLEKLEINVKFRESLENQD